MVDAEATTPNKSSGVPRLVAKGFRTGFLDMVELRMANNPIMQIIMKKKRSADLLISIVLKECLDRLFFVCDPRERSWFINAVFIFL